jgi:KUP system potassium uptake protein
MVLFAAVFALVVGFGSSQALASAYGIAVTGTLAIDTILFFVVVRALWHKPLWLAIAGAVAFLVVDLGFFSANVPKVVHGGWFPLTIALIVFTVLITWQRGREIVTARRIELEGPLPAFLEEVHAAQVPRVPGTAVFPHPAKETTPLALRANLQHNHVLHERVVIISGRTENVPHISWEQRLAVDHLGDPAAGHHDHRVRPRVLRQAALQGEGERRAGQRRRPGRAGRRRGGGAPDDDQAGPHPPSP